MANKRHWLEMLVMVLVFGIAIAGCDNGSTEGGDSNATKTLVFQNVPANFYSEFAYAVQYGGGGEIGLYPVGTTLQQALYWDNVAGAALSNSDISAVGPSGGPYTITVPLYADLGVRWNGNGTYDVYLLLYSNEGDRYLRVSSVNISSATTNIQYSRIIEVYP